MSCLVAVAVRPSSSEVSDMIRQKRVQQVVGRDVLTSDGKWQRIIGNNIVFPGCYVWADGNVVYGNLMPRGTMALAVFSDKYVLPLMTGNIDEKGQTVEYTIDVPVLEENYPDNFFPRTGSTGAFACTSNFYLTTTHDNLLDFCVADATEQNPPPARLVNAIESVPASKNLSADGYLGAYEKISGKIYDTGYWILWISNTNGYISFVKYKLEENTDLFHYVDGHYVPTPSKINEGVAVDCTVESATKVIDRQEETTQYGKTLVTICGTNTEVDLVKITLNNFGDDFINVINGVNLDSPQITSINCTVIDARVNGDGKWIMRINARMYANAYYTYSYAHTFLSVYYENTVRIGTDPETYEDLHTGECYYTLKFNEKGGFHKTNTFSYLETVDFWLSSDGKITLVQKKIKDYSINRLSPLVKGDWFVKEQNGEENPWMVTRDIHLEPGEYKVKDYDTFIKTAMASTIEWEQHYFDAQYYYVYNSTVIDKTINITETNAKPMTIDVGKGNKLTFKSIPENHGSTPKIEIVSIHDAAGNEYADLAGQKISGVGFLDIESWRGKTFFIYRPYSKYQSILKVDGKNDGHNPCLTSRISVMKKRDLKNGALVDWS